MMRTAFAFLCVRDVLNLFNVQTAPVAPVRTVIYPSRMKVQLLLSQASAGTPQPEGKMQNRKGNDPSEMFDLREYARLMLLTAGQYTASLKPLEGRIGTTVISAVSGGIALEVYEERTVRSFLEHLVTTNKNTSFKTRFKLHYAGLLYPWFARAQKAQLTD